MSTMPPMAAWIEWVFDPRSKVRSGTSQSAAPTEGSRASLDRRCLSVMEDVLALPLISTPDLRPELKRYAQAARRGSVQ
jgi:hypothetical protein